MEVREVTEARERGREVVRRLESEVVRRLQSEVGKQGGESLLVRVPYHFLLAFLAHDPFHYL